MEMHFGFCPHRIVMLGLFFDSVHCEFSNIFLWMQNDDPEFGAVETEEGDIGAQADGHAQGGYLDLKAVLVENFP